MTRLVDHCAALCGLSIAGNILALKGFYFVFGTVLNKFQLCSLNETVKDGKDCYGDEVLYKLFISILHDIRIEKRSRVYSQTKPARW